MTLPEIIGKRVSEARQAKRLSQEALAELIEKAIPTISNIERGKVYTSLDTLEKIAKGLSKPVSYFFEDVEAIGRMKPARYSLEQEALGQLKRLTDRDAELALSLLKAFVKHRAA